MAELTPPAQRLRDGNEQLSAKRREIYRLRVSSSELAQKLTQLQRRGDLAESQRLAREIRRIDDRRDSLGEAIRLDAAELESVATDWVTNTPDPFADLAVDSNVALLPVRLETRFKPDENDDDQLLVRIYPDDIHVNAHEPELTAHEREMGQSYWLQSEGADEVARQNAWAALADEFGAPRASWIVKTTDPDGAAATEERDDDWTRGAFTNVLPDRWVIVGMVNGAERFRVWGNPIPDQLKVGIDPTIEADTLEGQDTSLGNLDPELNWLEDFAAAEAVGMGVRVTADKLSQGNTIDLLLAVGVKSTLSRQDSGARLHELFSAHRYTQGMAFIPRGIPTNNTEQTSAGFTSQDVAHDRSFAAQQIPGEELDPMSSGARLADAFGLEDDDRAVFSGLEHAEAMDHGDAQAMQAALWPVTWGYYLKEMMDDEVSDADIEFGRRFFLDWVRAGGWLSSVRIGQQPYAFWPVTDSRQWQADADRDEKDQLAGFINYLKLLSSRWINASNHVPTVGTFNNPAANLMSVLGMDGVSRHHYARGLDSGVYLSNLWAMNEWPADPAELDSLQYLPNNVALVEELARLYDIEVWDPRIRLLMFHAATLKLNGPRIQYGGVSDQAALSDNYIAWLLQASPSEIEKELPYAGKHMPLLYLLLRHAASLEYGRTAFNISEELGVVARTSSHEPVLVNFEGSSQLTYQSILHERYADATGEMTFSEHVHRFQATYRKRDAQFDAFWSAINRLQNLPTASLDLLLRETLDLASHRMDAWMGGFANQRMSEIQAKEASSTYIGGFGWVENLHKRFKPRSEGRILAPSLDHATAAAILRAGYVAHKKQTDKNALAVNLASDRVRIAKQVLDGVANGLPLGAVLGYRFERMLHEHPQSPSLDRYIYPFRKLTPLSNQLSEDDLVATGQVVDGYKLHQRFKDGGLALSFVQSAHRNAVTDTLRELGHIIDAVGDSLLAEGMFQTVKRNRERTRVTLDSVARGETDPPELEFARSARPGVSFTHRVVLSLPEDTATPDWPTNDAQVRQVAEPRINAWLASLLPPATSSGCVVNYGEVASATITVADLGLSPLDLLYLSAAGYGPGTELYRRFLQAAVTQAPDTVDMLAGIKIVLHFDRPINADPTTVLFTRLMKQIDGLREFVQEVRYVRPHEIAAMDQADAAAWDVQELRDRADAVVAKLRAWQSNAASGNPLVPIGERVDQLWQARSFGLEQSLPEMDSLDALLQDHLRQQVERVEQIVLKLLSQHDALEAQFDRASAEATQFVEHDIARLQLLLSEAFVIVPRFVPSHEAEYQAAVAHHETILGENAETALPQYAWFAKYARVQKGVGQLNRAFVAANRARRHDVVNLSILQFPFEPGAKWIGLPFDDAEPETAANKVSVALFGDVPTGAHFAGLLVDAWTESVPNAKSDAAISFHFDQPGSRAPNAVLLATPPRLGEAWSVDTMLSVVQYALLTAKMRAVDATALNGVGQFLPAITLATNESGETVSTDIGRATRPMLLVTPILDVVLEARNT